MIKNKEVKLKMIKDLCEEKSYKIIKDIEDVKDRTKIHIEDTEGYKGVINIGRFIRREYDVAFWKKGNPYILDNIRLWISIYAPNLTLVSTEYKNSRTHLLFECCYHGEYMATLDNIKAGYNCRKCGSVIASEKEREDIEVVKKAFIEKGYKPLFDTYINRQSPLDVEDGEGYKYSTKYMNIKNCEKLNPFSWKNKYTIDNIKLWLKRNNLDDKYELLSDTYIDAHTNLKFYCKIHNKITYATWNNASKYKICYDCGLDKRSGENAPNYNPDLTQEERDLKRNYIGKDNIARWRNSVFERDNYRCVCCGEKGRINAHHKDGWHWCKERRIDIDNGVTLCEEHHKEFHKIYGNKNNTEEQFNEFYKMKTGQDYENKLKSA